MDWIYAWYQPPFHHSIYDCIDNYNYKAAKALKLAKIVDYFGCIG